VRARVIEKSRNKKGWIRKKLVITQSYIFVTVADIA